MIQDLWRREMFGRSKGVSTVVATIFLVIVVLSILANVFIWTISQNNLYSRSVRESHQLDADRFSERVIAYSGNYLVWSDKVEVRGVLANEGPVSAQVLTLWVLDENNKEYNITDLREGNFNLNPGDTLPITIEVTIPGAGSNHTFNSWFVTARGNIVSLEEEETIIIAHIAQGVGSMALDFYTFRYFFYEVGAPQKLKDYPTGVRSFNVPRAPEIAFGINLTNLDPRKQPIFLNQYSQVWIYFPKAPGQSYVWHIVNVKPDGTISTPYSLISLGFGESKLLVFASGTPGEFTKVSLQPAVKNLPCALNLLLLGTIGSNDYGQNIPFVSLYIYEP